MQPFFASGICSSQGLLLDSYCAQILEEYMTREYIQD